MSDKSVSLTYSFLLPLIGKTFQFYSPYLLEVFLMDNTMKDYNTPGNIFLLLNNISQIERLLASLRGFDSYVAEYSVTEFETMVVLKIPDKFMPDYYIFLSGKYSLMSTIAKDTIIAVSKPNGNNVKILNRDPDLKRQWEERLDVTLPEDAEVYGKPEVEKETYFGFKERETSP